jgi:hypothetical protein
MTFHRSLVLFIKFDLNEFRLKALDANNTGLFERTSILKNRFSDTIIFYQDQPWSRIPEWIRGLIIWTQMEFNKIIVGQYSNSLSK